MSVGMRVNQHIVHEILFLITVNLFTFGSGTLLNFALFFPFYSAG